MEFGWTLVWCARVNSQTSIADILTVNLLNPHKATPSEINKLTRIIHIVFSVILEEFGLVNTHTGSVCGSEQESSSCKSGSSAQ